MMQNMLFDIRIQSPSPLRNLTLAHRFATMEWSDEAVSRAVQDKVIVKHAKICTKWGVSTPQPEGTGPFFALRAPPGRPRAVEQRGKK